MSTHAERRRKRSNPVPQSNSSLRLQIERLAIYGFPRSEAPRLATAIESELGALATQPAHLAPLAAGNVRSPRITPGRTPEHTGCAAAGAVWSSIASGALR